MPEGAQMSIRFRSTGSPIDFIKVFTLEQAASALMFNQTGKNCPTNIKRDNTEYGGFWEWYDILFYSIQDEETPLIAYLPKQEEDFLYCCTEYSINRKDFEDWCNNKGISPGFLFEETELNAPPTITQNISKISRIDRRIDKIIEILSAAGHNAYPYA